MNQQDFLDAYILFFSGAAKMKNKREMYWYDEDNNEITVEFVDFTRYCIVRGYRKNGQLYWEINYKNGNRNGVSKVWYKNGQIAYNGSF